MYFASTASTISDLLEILVFELLCVRKYIVPVSVNLNKICATRATCLNISGIEK